METDDVSIENGRVTQRELYEQMRAMESRIMTAIDSIREDVAALDAEGLARGGEAAAGRQEANETDAMLRGNGGSGGLVGRVARLERTVVVLTRAAVVLFGIDLVMHADELPKLAQAVGRVLGLH